MQDIRTTSLLLNRVPDAREASKPRIGPDTRPDRPIGLEAATGQLARKPRPRKWKTPSCAPRRKSRISAGARRKTSPRAHKFAIESFAEALVPVQDSLEMALKIETPSIESLKDGVEMTLKQLDCGV